jgi:spore germination protein YaaH/flagellar hook assembly protein FlgD
VPRSLRPGRLLRSLVTGALGLVVVVGALPVPAAAAPTSPEERTVEVVDPPAAEAGKGQRPSEAYEAWVQHADDEIDFTPGERVTVGFKPRADDSWTVGGAAPVALPPGRATGRTMARQPNVTRGPSDAPGAAPRPRSKDGSGSGSTPPRDRVNAPIDAPSNRLALPARSVSLAQPASEPEVELGRASRVRRQVFGFLPYWEVNGAATRLHYDVLSTIAYFSVGVNDKGGLKKRDPDGTLTTGWAGWTSSGMTRVINAAHARGTRVVLTVTAFAWTTSQARVQKAVLGSSGARRTLARQIVAAVRDRGADGVNLDFEPLARGYADEFVSLLRTIRREFNRVRSGYQITYDTTAYIGNYPLEASVGKRAADAIFVMGYDFRIGNSSTAGSISPLSGSGYDLGDTVRAYKRRVPGSRLILGIPWYGRAWSTATDNPRSRTLSGAKYGYSRAVNYENVVDYVRKHGRRWDRVEQSPYVAYRRRNCTKTYGCVTSWRQIWYEDGASLKRRYALVNEYGLRGAGMWALGYEGGRRELYRALADSFLVAHSAPTASIRALSTSQRDEGFIVKWVGKGNTRIASYDVQVSTNGGPWRTWRSNTKATSDVFLGRTGVGYAFRVRARDAAGSVGAFGALRRTTVRAGIRRLDFGANGAATGLGTSVAQLAARAFSPNRDGSEDGIRLRWTNATRMRSVVVRVLRLDGRVIGTRTIRARAAGGLAWTWDGKVNGRRLRDGRYLLQLVGSAGGRTFRAPSARPATTDQVARYAVRIDTRRPTIASASGTNQVISPNGDGTRDSTRLYLAAKGGAVRWTVSVTNVAGATVRAQTGSGAAVTYTWRGTDARGRRVPDGQYAITVALLDAAGNAARRTAKVTVDTAPPRVRPSATPRGFSPNGDGQLDATVLGWTAPERASGSVKLFKGSRLIRTWKTTNVAAWKATWDGRRADGSRVGDGTYTLRVDVKDGAGNRRVATTKLVLDRTVKALAWSGDLSSQDGDTLKQTSRLAWRLSRDAKTRLRVTDAAGRVVRTAWSGRAQGDGARGWTWNGRRDDGSFVPQGRYLATLRVKSPYGTLEYSRWVWATAFTLTPNRTVVKAGQKLVVRFRSVEPLSTKPRVTFRQPGRDAVTVTARKLDDGSWKASYRVRSGRGGTATIRVIATDKWGGRNATRTTVRVK